MTSKLTQWISPNSYLTWPLSNIWTNRYSLLKYSFPLKIHCPVSFNGQSILLSSDSFSYSVLPLIAGIPHSLFLGLLILPFLLCSVLSSPFFFSLSSLSFLRDLVIFHDLNDIYMLKRLTFYLPDLPALFSEIQTPFVNCLLGILLFECLTDISDRNSRSECRWPSTNLLLTPESPSQGTVSPCALLLQGVSGLFLLF